MEKKLRQATELQLQRAEGKQLLSDQRTKAEAVPALRAELDELQAAATRLEEEHLAVEAAQAAQAASEGGAAGGGIGGAAGGGGAAASKTRRGGKKKGKAAAGEVAGDEEAEAAAVPAAAAAVGADAAETDPFELLTTERFKYVAPGWR